MAKGELLRGSKFGDSNRGRKPPNVNWLQHADAFANFSCQENFLSSSFLFSLATQKPFPEESAERVLWARPIVCEIQRIESLRISEVEKSWKALCSNRVPLTNYGRPGLTESTDDLPSRSLNSSYDIKLAAKFQHSGCPTQSNAIKQSANLQQFGVSTHVNCYTSPVSDSPCNSMMKGNTSNYRKDSFLRSSNIDVGSKMKQPIPIETSMPGFASCPHSENYHDINNIDVGSKTKQQILRDTSMPDSASRPHFQNDHDVHINHDMVDGDNFLDNLDDDDILKNIDVDQIVTEHYQATKTPKGPASKERPLSPFTSMSNVTDHVEYTLPVEICEKCNHDFMLALCPDSTSHLQVMKDRLIMLSNELLDNAAELSARQFQNLHQERSDLKKKVQELEMYLKCSSENDERQKSQSMASTAAQSFHRETPVSTFKVDPQRFNSQLQIRSERGNCGNLNTPGQFSYVDSSSVIPVPLERETCNPEVLEINYLEENVQVSSNSSAATMQHSANCNVGERNSKESAR